MKHKIVILLLILILFNFTTASFGASGTIPTTLYINGSYVSTEAEPLTLNGMIYIPIKVFTDGVGIDEVVFSQEDLSVSIINGDKTIKLFIDEKRIQINNIEYIISSKPILYNNRTMVSLDFISEIFNCEVSFDNLTRSIFLNNKDLIIIPTDNEDGYTPEDVLWLSRIVHVEAHSTTYECKLAVANVVLNRKNSNRFPNTIYDVIFQKGQFPPAHKSSFATLVPSEECILAAKNALNGENNISTCLFFNNRPFSSKTSDLYKIIGGEYFYN